MLPVIYRRSLRQWQARRLVNRLPTLSGNIVYLGGSITLGTAGVSYADSFVSRISTWLDEEYPGSTLTHLNQGVAGTPSWYGLVRLEADVIDYSPEAVLIDFAVNDHGQSIGDRASGFYPASEALIRRLRTALSYTTLIGLNFVWPESYSYFDSSYGNPSRMWQALASRYQLPMINFGREIMRAEGTYAPSDGETEGYLYAAGNVHPNAAGHGLIYQALKTYLRNRQNTATTRTWSASLPARLYSEAEDFEHTPIIRNGVNNDGETGTGWSTSGTARWSETADDTIQWTGEFCSFGADYYVGASSGVVAWDVDGGGFTNLDLTALTVANRALWNLERGTHTVTFKVVSGLVRINRFLAI